MAEKSQITSRGPTILKRLSVTDIEGAQKAAGALKDKEGQELRLARVYGYARGTRPKDTPHGITTQIEGTFEAQSLTDGKFYRSPILFLPGAGAQMIVDELSTLPEGDTNGVEFAVEIKAMSDKRSPVGYKYSMMSLIKPKESDLLSGLRKSVTEFMDVGDMTIDIDPALEAAAPQAQLPAPAAEAATHQDPPQTEAADVAAAGAGTTYAEHDRKRRK